jgi:hypothetical protein
MKIAAIRTCMRGVFCFALLAGSASAQHPTASARAAAGSYSLANEVSVQGTVLNYTENSSVPPIGTHVLVQTASGNIDVHLGDARLLHLANLKITPGAGVRFVGQAQRVGANSIFLARLVQVGTQVLAIRTEQGFLLGPKGVHAAANKTVFANLAADQKGVAR